MKKSKKSDLALILQEFNEVTFLPDTESHRFRMEVPSSSSDRMYVVSQNKRGVHAGRWECGCRGWITHRNCKHLKEMLPALQQIAKLHLEDKRGAKKRR